VSRKKQYVNSLCRVKPAREQGASRARGRYGVASLFLVFTLIYPLGNDTDRRVMQSREVAISFGVYS